MDDATYTFIQDVKSRKATARSAKHRVCGSKSKKCTLPSDRLTPAQWKRRNSPVTTYNLSKPMTFEQFKTMNPALQKTYLINLLENHRASNTDIAEMFGITASAISQRRMKLGIIPGLGRKTRPTAEDRARWAHFLAQAEEPAEGATEPHSTTPDPEPVEEMTPIEAPAEPEVSVPGIVTPVSFTVTLRSTPGEFVRWLHKNFTGAACDEVYEFTVSRKEG